LTWLLFATARRKGEVRLEPDDVFVYNVAARPYMSGYGALSLRELFDFQFSPTVEAMENMSFQQRIQAGFQMGLRSGIDVIGSISSVLVKVGDEFAKGASTTRISADMLYLPVLLRMGRAWIRSRLAGRPLLPKDLWQVKGMAVSGMDTDIYRERLREYWGVEPCEAYGVTEGPAVIAVQTWDSPGLYFLPDVCFFEFVPEAEWAHWREDKGYTPTTVLLDEVLPGERYEVVITNFYGGPFLRYRLHDLVRFTSLRDERAGIELPSLVFAGRDSGFIDLASFTGLIDEKMVWQAIADARVSYEEWAIRKEMLDEHPGLQLYIELKEESSAEEVADRVHTAMLSLNPFYGDLSSFLEIRPLRVTLLPQGTFARYMQKQEAAGADISHLKPPHMNASDAVIADLLQLGEAAA
jgi:hypothetical protein